MHQGTAKYKGQESVVVCLGFVAAELQNSCIASQKLWPGQFSRLVAVAAGLGRYVDGNVRLCA